MNKTIHSFSRGFALSLLAVAAACGLSSCPEACKCPIKAGFLYWETPFGLSWTYQHEQGRLALLKEPYIESAPAVSVTGDAGSAEIQTALNLLVQKGCKIVFATSYDFMDEMRIVAEANPGVKFMNCTDSGTGDNWGTYNTRTYQADYLTGLLAGALTQSGRVGYVAPRPLLLQMSRINAFAIGVREQNSNAVIHVRWIGAWSDPALERVAAQTLIDEGADVLANAQDTATANEVAEANGVYSFGSNTDMSCSAPTSHVTATVYNWGAFYKYYCRKVQLDAWEPEEAWWGYKRNAIGLSPYSDAVTPAMASLLDDRIAGFRKGDFEVFAGPIYDNVGALRVAEGLSATDAEILNMDYLVQGVVEDTPRGTK